MDDIFKVMKGKNLQPRILYLARLSLSFVGKIKSFPDKQHPHTSFPANAKGTALHSKHKRRKRPTETRPEQVRHR